MNMLENQVTCKSSYCYKIKAEFLSNLLDAPENSNPFEFKAARNIYRDIAHRVSVRFPWFVVHLV